MGLLGNIPDPNFADLNARRVDPAFMDLFGPQGGGSPAAPMGVPGQPAIDPQQQSDDLFKKIMHFTSGRANELRNDPVQSQVMKYLQGVLSGKQVPYNDTVLNSLQAQHGRGTASAEAAQMQSLRDSVGAQGGSIYDPSYGAAQREAMSQRQGANLDYSGQLNAQAGLANFNAQQNAGGMLGQLRGQQNAQINGLQGQAAGYTAGRFYEQPSATPAFPQTLMPQYGGGGQMGQAGQTGAAQPQSSPAQPAPAPQPQAAAPKPAPAPAQQQSQPQGGLLPHPDMTSGWTRKAYDPNVMLGLMQPGGY